MANRPPIESASFWEMAALATDGKLASCQSCVEFYYFQSQQNAVAFLDSCAAGGLVEKVSLLDLHGGIGPSSGPARTLRQQWYDQAIYISAPAFRKQNLDAARKKIEGTKNAVYNAFHLYHEVLGANDAAISASYRQAVEDRLLRYSELAKDRLDVDLSPVAKMRLIQDGFRSSIKKGNGSSRSEIEKRVTASTVEFVLRFWDKEPDHPDAVHSHAEELELFIYEFFAGEYRMEPQAERRVDFRRQLLPVISELVRQRIKALNVNGLFDRANSFETIVRDHIHKSQQQAVQDSEYVEALSDFIFDLDVAYDKDLSAPFIASEAHWSDRSAPLE